MVNRSAINLANLPLVYFECFSNSVKSHSYRERDYTELLSYKIFISIDHISIMLERKIKRVSHIGCRPINILRKEERTFVSYSPNSTIKVSDAFFTFFNYKPVFLIIIIKRNSAKPPQFSSLNN
jgi:hypothetical protein